MTCVRAPDLECFAPSCALWVPEYGKCLYAMELKDLEIVKKTAGSAYQRLLARKLIARAILGSTPESTPIEGETAANEERARVRRIA